MFTSVSSVLVAPFAMADADMAFHGTLIAPPPCTISDNNRIDVGFGDRVGIKKVDGVNYRTLVNYQIQCEKGKSGNWALTLSLSGTSASFDKNALVTNKAELGIRIYANDKPFMPGSAVNITLNNPPRLEAVPVKKVGSDLNEGAFEAWATLRADYN